MSTLIWLPIDNFAGMDTRVKNRQAISVCTEYGPTFFGYDFCPMPHDELYGYVMRFARAHRAEMGFIAIQQDDEAEPPKILSRPVVSKWLNDGNAELAIIFNAQWAQQTDVGAKFIYSLPGEIFGGYIRRAPNEHIGWASYLDVKNFLGLY